MKSFPTDGLTHKANMMQVEEILKSALVPHQQSNTKNVLPGLNFHYSTYLASTTAWFLWDKKFEHVLFQWFKKTMFDTDDDKHAKVFYFNAFAIYETGVLPNVGIVGSLGT